MGSNSLLMQFAIRLNLPLGENPRDAISTSPFGSGADRVCCRKCVLRGGQNRYHRPPVQEFRFVSVVRSSFPTDATILARPNNGVPIKQIVRQTGHSRKLVRQVIRGERNDVFRIR